MRHLILAVLFAVIAAPTLAANPDCEAAISAKAISQLAQTTNQLRAAHGQPGLRTDARLNLAAQRHACDLARRQVASHRDAMGRRPMARIQHVGYHACFSAENVAQGTESAGITVRAWQASPGHARNQQDARARSMGFGVARGADGRHYWVGLYAADCETGQKRSGLRPFIW